jgi:hypothetical protein
VTLGFQVNANPYTQSQADSALTSFGAALVALYDSEVTFARLVTLVNNGAGPLTRYDSTSTSQGTRASVTIASPNVTYLIRKQTNLAGRQYRGRMYLPFVNAGGVTQTGQLSSAELTILAARASALTTGLITGPNNVVQFALLHGVPKVGSAPSPTTCTISAENFVATQRRRLDRP